jgi:hypothetical protein
MDQLDQSQGGQAVSEHFVASHRDELLGENRQLKERIKRLEEAGDYLCAAAAFMGWHDKIETWNKAKGDKL